ncbi:MAG: hypothetical protein AB7K52_11360 [Phycisphaerales bacterium]
MLKTIRTCVQARVLASALAILVPAVAAAPARAGDTVHLSPEQVLAQADVIFQGTVESKRFGWTDQRQVFATSEYTIVIERVLLDRDGWLAGRTQNGRAQLSIMGGEQNGVRYRVSGLPVLEAGESAFFLLSGEDLRNRAMSPIVGDSEGLFRVAFENGERKVFTPGGCSGPSRPVDFRFFSKLRDPQASYTPDEFAAEIVRALPIAAASPELRLVGSKGVPAHARQLGFGPDQHVPLEVAQPGAPAPAAGESMIWAPVSVIAKPEPREGRRFVEAEAIEQPRLEFGFPPDTDPPAYPIVFNVPPGTWWRQAFLDEQARWNRYSAGVFRFFADSNNQIGWPNGRNETGFLTSQQMIDLYGRGWGGNTLARCVTREGAFTDRIVEADIAYNVAQTFSENQGVIYANPSINSFRSTALHELGHAFGRVHAWESNPASFNPSCLNYSTNGFYDAEHDRVFADDAESIRFAYGAWAINQTDFGITLWRNSGSLVPFGNPPINVNGVTGLSMPGSVLQGNFFPINNIWLENIGTVTRATTIDWLLDPTPYDYNLSDAYYCSSTSIGTLARYNGVIVNTNVPAPQGIPPGNYYLCAVIVDNDAIVDNDFAWSQGTIRVDYNPAFGPPANDSRNSPQSIGIGTFSGSTQFATTDGTASCGLSNASPDVWFTFVAPYAGSFEADTCGSGFDTVLSVSRREFSPVIGGGFNYVELNCNDDAVGGDCSGSTQSRVFVNNVSAGSILRLRLAGFNGARGNYVLRTRIYPGNDFCADAVPVTAGTYTATLAGATNDRTGSCGQSQTTPDVWFRYTWPDGCNTVQLNTVGSNFDTVLEVLPVCSAFNIPAIACNDDCSGVGPSCVTVNRGAETTLRIRVSRYGLTPPTGDLVVLNVSTPAPTNDACAAAVALPDGDYFFDNSCGATDALPLPSGCFSSECVNDFWFRYTAPMSGQLQIVATAAFPMSLALYPGFACPGDPEQAIACDIGVPGGSLLASVVAGEELLVRIGGSVQPGFPGIPAGTGTLSIHTTETAPANDFAAAADRVAPGQFIQGALALATPDGSSSVDRVAGGPDVWYGFLAPADGRLIARSCGTLNAFGLDTVLSIHVPLEDGSLVELAASDTHDPAPCGEGVLPDVEDASVALDVAANHYYVIRVAATDPALVGTGGFSLSVEFVAPSDSCATFGELFEGENLFSTGGASADGPAHECFDGTEADVWFAYTPSCTGMTLISTCAQPYDTKLAVYLVSCPTVDDLPIACNSDDGVECAGAGASLMFPSAVGTNYFIRVAGDVPTPQIITLACLADAHAADVCGNGNPIIDHEALPITTAFASASGDVGGCFDGSERDVWYTYTATCTGTVRLAFCQPDEMTDSKIGVYAGTDCPVGEPIACNDDDGPGCPGVGASLEFAAIAGETFQVRFAIADDAEHLLSVMCTPAPTCPADFNQDGNVDPDDLGDYINCYFAIPPCESADFNQDGNVDPDDLGDFINTYFGPPC